MNYEEALTSTLSRQTYQMPKKWDQQTGYMQSYLGGRPQSRCRSLSLGSSHIAEIHLLVVGGTDKLNAPRPGQGTEGKAELF